MGQRHEHHAFENTVHPAQKHFPLRQNHGNSANLNVVKSEQKL